jgi:chromosome segregation ATPase
VIDHLPRQASQVQARRRAELQLQRDQEQEAALLSKLALVEKEQPKIAQQLVAVGQEIDTLAEAASSIDEEVGELTAKDNEEQALIQQLERSLNSLQDPRQVLLPPPLLLPVGPYIALCAGVLHEVGVDHGEEWSQRQRPH